MCVSMCRAVNGVDTLKGIEENGIEALGTIQHSRMVLDKTCQKRSHRCLCRVT